MGMNERQFDKVFRDRLQDLPSEVPEDMWERIRQNKGKDRKIAVFWWRFLWGMLFAGLLVLGGGYWAMRTGNDQRTSYVAKTGTRAKTDQVGLTNQNAGTSVSGKQGVAKTNIHTTVGAQSKIAAGTRSDKTAPRHLSGQDGKKGRAGANKDTGSKAATPPMATKDPISANVPVATKTPPAAKTPAPPKPVEPGIAGSKKIDPANSAAKKANRSEEAGDGKWSVDLYGSPDLPFNRIISSDPNIVQFQKSFMKMRLSYAVGFRVSRAFGEHFSVKTGLQYSVINEKIQFDSIGSAFRRRIKGLDIPLLIGYETGNGRFRIAVNAGILFDLHAWYTSTPFDSLGYTYRSNLGTSLYLGFGFAERLNENIFLFAEPHFQYRLSDMTSKGSLFRERIDILGLSLGARYNFQKNHIH
jgi:hypothetical protein